MRLPPDSQPAAPAGEVSLTSINSTTPEKPEVAGHEHQHGSKVHGQSLPEMVPEEQDVVRGEDRLTAEDLTGFVRLAVPVRE